MLDQIAKWIGYTVMIAAMLGVMILMMAGAMVNLDCVINGPACQLCKKESEK